MKLSEAIRIGSADTLPLIGSFFAQDEGKLMACSIGAALHALNIEEAVEDAWGPDVMNRLENALGTDIHTRVVFPYTETPQVPYDATTWANDVTFKDAPDPRLEVAKMLEEVGL